MHASSFHAYTLCLCLPLSFSLSLVIFFLPRSHSLSPQHLPGSNFLFSPFPPSPFFFFNLKFWTTFHLSLSISLSASISYLPSPLSLAASHARSPAFSVLRRPPKLFPTSPVLLLFFHLSLSPSLALLLSFVLSLSLSVSRSLSVSLPLPLALYRALSRSRSHCLPLSLSHTPHRLFLRLLLCSPPCSPSIPLWKSIPDLCVFGALSLLLTGLCLNLIHPLFSLSLLSDILGVMFPYTYSACLLGLYHLVGKALT